MSSRDQALSLMSSAAASGGDVAAKLSSLNQAKEILLSMEPSATSELFPFLVDLQYSPDAPVRKLLLQIIEEIGLRGLEHSRIFMPILLGSLKDIDPFVCRECIVCGMHFFCRILEELVVQFHKRGKVERWLEEIWIWMLEFKEFVFRIVVEPGSIGTKLLQLKFLETCVLLFTPDSNDYDKPGVEGSRNGFNISWLPGDHPVLESVSLTGDAKRALHILFSLLQSAGSLPGPLTIAVVNCLAAIARKRVIHYGTVLSALLDFDPNVKMLKGCHTSSVQHSIRTAFLGFLRCTYSPILESREKLLTALRAMNAGDAADQAIRQVDKLIKNNERATRESRVTRDDQQSGQVPAIGDQVRKRSAHPDDEEHDNGHEVALKRTRYVSEAPRTVPVHANNSELDAFLANGTSTDIPLLNGELTPVEQMITMIGALVAEGERGAESLELLISNIHPDLLADIVITNMKHLPKSVPPLTSYGILQVTHQIGNPSGSAAPTNSVSTVQPAQLPLPVATVHSSTFSEMSTVSNFPVDSKRDPRRDPRRLDPRRMAPPAEVQSMPVVDETNAIQPEVDGSISSEKPLSLPAVISGESHPVPLILNIRGDDNSLEGPLNSETDQVHVKDEVFTKAEEFAKVSDANISSDHTLSPPQTAEEDSLTMKFSDVEVPYEADSSMKELDPGVTSTQLPEEASQDLPQLPPYVELLEEQKSNITKLAVEHIIESCKDQTVDDRGQMRMTLLARLASQVNADDNIMVMLQKHVIADYQQQKGHELVLHILYHLNSLMLRDSVEGSTYGAVVYEKFLLTVAMSLLDNFPASDKSLSRLFGEVPFLPESAVKLLGDLCSCDVVDSYGKEIRDVERVTQGLGAVWALIVGRPNNREACLDIALKCTVHSQDDIRAKAIRLVANKLFQLTYISQHIEKFAANMLLSAVDQQTSSTEQPQSESVDHREGKVGCEEQSVGGFDVLDVVRDENDNATRVVNSLVQNVSNISFPEAQRLSSLFFALCTKKPSLLQHIFDIYGRAPKAVKQAIHRHIPIVIRALGSSYSELLHIISDPPEGCENLLMLVLQTLTQETTPSSDLIATVKHLHEIKLKDATVLIPILSSLSKDEVLPIFPRLVGLPIEKFQMALAHILQGSAHTGPALTPAEVLVAIHDISPEKDGLPLKKITNACSACFEQRTIFTQHVLAKALNQMVDQTPLPLLFMRTVIQAIDAFPSMVDFVMELLSKLVSKQVWKMPKLWVGFLKCISQTQPHSFPVLLQLPAPQLESALNKHPNLRSPLAAYASQPNTKHSLPRPTLALLGLGNEMQMPQPPLSSLLTSDVSSSARGGSLT